MRVVRQNLFAFALASVVLIIQYPLWLGKGSWLRVWDLSRQVDTQHAKNASLTARNAGLDAEVRDLKQGTEAVEERARAELGMIKTDEIYLQIVDAVAAAKRPQ